MAYITCVNNNCCYCWSCHVDRIVRFEDMSPADLLRELLRSEREEIIAVNKTFEQVLLQACIGKVYRRQIYNLHRYRNTKSYLKSIGYTMEEAETLAKKINTGNSVYDNMGIICGNIFKYPKIDIKRLSLQQLNFARQSQWCCNYEQLMKGKSSKPDHLEYTEEDFQDFIRLAKDHPVFKSIEKNEANDYGRKAISSLFLRVGNVLTKH